MPASQYPPDLGNDLSQIKRRLELLEKALGLSATTIVNDNGGITRVGIGQLDNIFPSAGYPADTYGARFQDSSGNLLIDTIGLAQVAKVIGSASDGSNTHTFAGTSAYELVGPQASFTLSRSGTVLCISTFLGRATGGSNGSVTVETALANSSNTIVAQSDNSLFVDTTSTGTSTQVYFAAFIKPVSGLAADTYNLEVLALENQTGMTLAYTSLTHVILQLGS